MGRVEPGFLEGRRFCSPTTIILPAAAAMTTISNTLTTGWSFAQRDDEKSFAPIEKVPTSVHVELLKAGKIPDPYKGVGEFDVQCEQIFSWSLRSELR